jgi:hypothetical protein
MSIQRHSVAALFAGALALWHAAMPAAAEGTNAGLLGWATFPAAGKMKPALRQGGSEVLDDLPAAPKLAAPGQRAPQPAHRPQEGDEPTLEFTAADPKTLPNLKGPKRMSVLPGDIVAARKGAGPRAPGSTADGKYLIKRLPGRVK